MAQKPMLRGEVGCACAAREVSVERGAQHVHHHVLRQVAPVLRGARHVHFHKETRIYMSRVALGGCQFLRYFLY